MSFLLQMVSKIQVRRKHKCRNWRSRDVITQLCYNLVIVVQDIKAETPQTNKDNHKIKFAEFQLWKEDWSVAAINYIIHHPNHLDIRSITKLFE